MKRSPMNRGASQLKRSAFSTLKTRPRSIKRDPADVWFSRYIRYRDGWQCQRCKTRYAVGSQGLHCSHFWGRARENTRFDPVNCDAMCHGCHAFLTANPELHRAWKLQQLGQVAYDSLMLRANLRCKKDRTLAAIVWKELAAREQLRYEENQCQ